MSQTINGSGDPRSFPDIHGIMDGKLFRYPIKTRFGIQEKQIIISQLIKLVETHANISIRNFGITGLHIIARDAGTAANWQGADGFFVDDVVVEIYDLLRQITDLEVIATQINHLCEQMSDMIRTSGLCPSGRLRVFQCYMILKDYVDGSYLPVNKN